MKTFQIKKLIMYLQEKKEMLKTKVNLLCIHLITEKILKELLSLHQDKL